MRTPRRLPEIIKLAMSHMMSMAGESQSHRTSFSTFSQLPPPENEPRAKKDQELGMASTKLRTPLDIIVPDPEPHPER